MIFRSSHGALRLCSSGFLRNKPDLSRNPLRKRAMPGSISVSNSKLTTKRGAMAGKKHGKYQSENHLPHLWLWYFPEGPVNSKPNILPIFGFSHCWFFFLLFMVENIRTHLRAFEHPGAGPGLRSNCLVQLGNFACTEPKFQYGTSRFLCTFFSGSILSFGGVDLYWHVFWFWEMPLPSTCHFLLDLNVQLLPQKNGRFLFVYKKSNLHGRFPIFVTKTASLLSCYV